MREYCEEFALENDVALIFWDGFDDAIVGLIDVLGKYKVVYSEAKIIEILMKEMDFESSLSYYYHNIACCYVGDHTPLHLQTPEI